MLDDEVLESFMLGFFGYGNPLADLWFIGMEEAGAGQETEMKSRLDAWFELGSVPLVDCAEFCSRVRFADASMDYLFKSPALIQSTWGPLIRLFMRAREGVTLTAEDIRGTQKASWARSDSANCLVQLMPLPSPSTDKRLYADWSRIQYLKGGREAYFDRLLSPRIDKIRGMIEAYPPKVVVFYGTSYLDHWSKIAGADFRKAADLSICKNAKGRDVRVRVMERGSNIYVSIYHPRYTKQAAYFEGVGDLLRQWSAGR